VNGAALAQWAAFCGFSAAAIAGALGMTLTMSMFRSAIFLMASLCATAGLFILLSADLLALLQVMMYVDGMVIMALFMVLFMEDPGGAMMAGMEMGALERFFTRGVRAEPLEHGMGGMQPMDMTMTTPIRKWAIAAALAIAALLAVLLLARHPWAVSSGAPDPRSAERIGQLLMGKYMAAFEGAGLLILLGIFGAVFLASPHRRGTYARDERAAVDALPQPLGEEKM
jgi:NADH-quinone oxidoreductase subunit J